MNTAQDVRNFVSSKTIAFAGVSRDGKAFSSSVYRDLAAKGYRLFPVNPNAETVCGEKSYPSLAALPEKPDAVLVFTAPAFTGAVVREAAERGIRNVWVQQGAESAEAVEFCRTSGLSAVTNRCIMMFVEPVGSLHKIHRFFAKLAGSLPK